jgi:heme A synthase
MVTVSDITAFLAVLLLILGQFFIGWKMVNKKSQKKEGQSSTRLYAKIEKPLYVLHLSASAIGFIIAIIHGVTAESVNLACKISGLILIITTLVMIILGVFLGRKNKMQPFGSDQDAENKNMRKIKWILTGILIFTLGIHFITHLL